MTLLQSPKDPVLPTLPHALNCKNIYQLEFGLATPLIQIEGAENKSDHIDMH